MHREKGGLRDEGRVCTRGQAGMCVGRKGVCGRHACCSVKYQRQSSLTRHCLRLAVAEAQTSHPAPAPRSPSTHPLLQSSPGGCCQWTCGVGVARMSRRTTCSLHWQHSWHKGLQQSGSLRNVMRPHGQPWQSWSSCGGRRKPQRGSWRSVKGPTSGMQPYPGTNHSRSQGRSSGTSAAGRQHACLSGERQARESVPK